MPEKTGGEQVAAGIFFSLLILIAILISNFSFDQDQDCDYGSRREGPGAQPR
jgi:hypothetical protein